MDSLDLTEFQRFIDEGARRLDEAFAIIARSQATLARACERLARDQPVCADVTQIEGLDAPEHRAQHTA